MLDTSLMVFYGERISYNNQATTMVLNSFRFKKRHSSISIVVMLLKCLHQQSQQGGRMHLQQDCGQHHPGRGDVSSVEDKTAIHIGLSKLEDQINLNLLKFNTDKCRVSTWDRAGPQIDASQHQTDHPWKWSSKVRLDRALGNLV
ncbi:protein disulfide-isomerase A5 [Grus japonensis]|uniref:Protein disulfide-isomerase A5 n=1 Tax=Grus japonensis TaxID=30415 RepID=A0ABC9WS53_GRUJA